MAEILTLGSVGRRVRLVVNGDASDRDRTWMLGGNEIGRTEEYKYLGIWLDERGCQKTKQDRLGSSTVQSK